MLYDQAQLAALYADGYQVKKKKQKTVSPFLIKKKKENQRQCMRAYEYLLRPPWGFGEQQHNQENKKYFVRLL